MLVILSEAKDLCNFSVSSAVKKLILIRVNLHKSAASRI